MENKFNDGREYELDNEETLSNSFDELLEELSKDVVPEENFDLKNNFHIKGVKTHSNHPKSKSISTLDLSSGNNFQNELDVLYEQEYEIEPNLEEEVMPRRVGYVKEVVSTPLPSTIPEVVSEVVEKIVPEFDDKSIPKVDLSIISGVKTPIISEIATTFIPGLTVRGVNEMDMVGSYGWYNNQIKLQEHQDHYDTLTSTKTKNDTINYVYIVMGVLAVLFSVKSLIGMLPELSNFNSDSLTVLGLMVVLPAIVGLALLFKAFKKMKGKKKEAKVSRPQVIPGVLDRKFTKKHKVKDGKVEFDYYVVLRTRGELITAFISKTDYHKAVRDDVFWMYRNSRTLRAELDYVEYTEEEVEDFVRPVEDSRIANVKERIKDLEHIRLDNSRQWFNNLTVDEETLNSLLKDKKYIKSNKKRNKIMLIVLVGMLVVIPLLMNFLYTGYVDGTVPFVFLAVFGGLSLIGLIVVIYRVATSKGHVADRAYEAVLIDKWLTGRMSRTNMNDVKYFVAVIIDDYLAELEVDRASYINNEIGSTVIAYGHNKFVDNSIYLFESNKEVE